MSDEMSRPAEMSPAQREIIIEEMNRILADPGFNRSKRCVILFGHLVNCALRGDRNEFKERTLGIEVFGRDPSYDSQADPIVRMTANEIRKRLAQYYQDQQASHHAVKIHLDRGTYFPEFDFDGSGISEPDEADAPEESSDSSILPHAEIQQPGSANAFARHVVEHKWLLLWIGIAILAFAAGTAFYHSHYSPARSRQDLFWGPLVQLNQPLMLCMADDPSLVGTSGEDNSQKIADMIASGKNASASTTPNWIPAIPFVDASTASRISNWLGAHGRQVIVHRSSIITLRMLRQGPTVLIGGFDNPWALTLLSHLRYSIRLDPTTHDKWIQDSQNPSKHDWIIKAGVRFEESFVDYAVVTRFWNNETENWIVAVTNLGPHGSHAASDLITDGLYDKYLPSTISSKGNFQVVVKTSVINGTTGPPQIIAAYSW